MDIKGCEGSDRDEVREMNDWRRGLNAGRYLDDSAKSIAVYIVRTSATVFRFLTVVTLG